MPRWRRAGFVVPAIVLACLPVAARADNGPVPADNALPGTQGWYSPTAPQPTPADQYAGKIASIDGWVWPLSARPGERLDLHVSAVGGVRYRVEVYRLGWYGGAGARLMACVPDCGADEAGVSQPAPPPPDPTTGEVRAPWGVTDSVPIGGDWPSGMYVAQLRITSGPGTGRVRRLPFVVTAPASQVSRILVVVPVNTWQAYNGWGGKALYDSHSADGRRASAVSFERPWMEGIEQSTWRYDEYPLVRFLERHALDVSYATDADVAARPEIVAGHAVVMTSGHGEYWTRQERDAFEAARAAGQSLAFMGANTGYWQVRYADEGHTLVGYKSTADPIADPALKTVRFRDVGRPECALLGVEYGAASGWDLGRSAGYGVVDTSLSDPWLAAGGFSAQATLPDTVGYEWDQVTPGCPTPPLTRLFHWPGSPGFDGADAVRYTAPSGATVFAAGSLQFSWGLDAWRYDSPSGASDPRLERFTMRMLADMGGGAGDGGRPGSGARPRAPAGVPSQRGPAQRLAGLRRQRRRAPLRVAVTSPRSLRRATRARFDYRLTNTTGAPVRGVVLVTTLPRGLDIDRVSRAANRRVRSASLRFVGGGRRAIFRIGTIGSRQAVTVSLSAFVSRAAGTGVRRNVLDLRRDGRVPVTVVSARVTIG